MEHTLVTRVTQCPVAWSQRQIVSTLARYPSKEPRRHGTAQATRIFVTSYHPMILPKSVAPVQYFLALSRLCALPGERSFVEFPLSLVRVSRSLERSEGMTAGGHLCGSFH